MKCYPGGTWNVIQEVHEMLSVIQEVMKCYPGGTWNVICYPGGIWNVICYPGGTWNNIYNGNIFPSLNPAKNFQFISRWTESTKSSAVGPNHRAVINTSNEVKSPLLWEFWIYNFSLRILERVLRWNHCKYKEWVSFFWVHGEWIVARNKQIGREPLRGSRDLFVPCYDSFPMNPGKKTLIP